jgi:hypothetical protein
MCSGWGLVDLNVICECKIRVSATFLSSPEDCFSSSFSGDCLSLGDVEGGDLIATPILDAALDICDLDMGLGVEAVEVHDYELA